MLEEWPDFHMKFTQAQRSDYHISQATNMAKVCSKIKHECPV